MIYGANFDLNGNQLQNASLHPVGSAPGSPKIGQVYTDTSGSTHLIKSWLNVAGTPQWVSVSTSANSFINPMTSVGDTMYGGTGGAATRLVGNTTTVRQFLAQTGDGSVSAAPVWGTLIATDIPNLAASKITSGQLAVAQGGTNKASWTQYGLVYNDTTTSFSQIVETLSSNKVLLSTSGGAPAFSGGTLTLPVSSSLTLGAYAVSFANAFSTTGAFAVSLTASAASTVALPPSTSAKMLYNTTQPAAANQLAYASTSGSALITYITAPTVLSVLTQSSNASAPAWTTATGTGSPVMGTAPTISNPTISGATTSITLTSGASFTAASGSTFQNNNTPTTDYDVTNKLYVDNVAIGLRDFKDSVRVATTATVTLSGGAPSTLDGIALAANDRILVKNQGTGSENGLYYVSTLGTGANGTWTRTTDANTSAKVTPGMYVFVEEGTATNRGKYILSTTGAITLGTTSLSFVRFQGGNELTQGTGITITGDTISLTSNQVTIGSTAVALGGTVTTFAGLTSVTSTTFVGALNGTATNATNIGITDDTAATTCYPTWVTASTGNVPAKTTSTKLTFNASTGVLSATGFSGSGASLTGLTAGNLSGTIPSAVLGNSTVYIGTTAVALNRASAGIALTGITSIAGTQFTGAVSLDASLGIAIADGAPGVTTNKLYNVGGSLYFNGNTVGSVKKYTTTFTGNGPTFGPYTHGLGSALIQVSIYDNNGNLMMCDVTVTSTQITLTFGYGVPGANTFTLVAVG